jgi:hypothetical protein
MKAKKVYEFKQGIDPYKAMDLGYAGKVRNWFDFWTGWTYGQDYEIKGNTTVIYAEYLDLEHSDLDWIPDGLNFVDGWFDLQFCRNLVELPERLTVSRYLNIIGCRNIKSLPKDLIVKKILWIDADWHRDMLLDVPGIKNVKMMS